MAYYNVLFDRGVDQVWERLGFGPTIPPRHADCTTYTAEFHLRYLREIGLGDQVRASFQLLDHDDKRIHFYQELIHTDGWVSATGEGMMLHVDQSGPRVAPMPADIGLANARCQPWPPRPSRPAASARPRPWAKPYRRSRRRMRRLRAGPHQRAKVNRILRAKSNPAWCAP